MKITRQQLKQLINEIINYNSLPKQGLPTLRKVIKQIIQPKDVYKIIDQLLQYYTIPPNQINANMVAYEMMRPNNNYYYNIIAKLRTHHPSIYNQMVGHGFESNTTLIPIVYNKKPQEIDLRRLSAEIQKIYNNDFIKSYLTTKASKL